MRLGPGILTLTARGDFLRAAQKGRSAAEPGLVLQAWPRGEDGAMRVGITATRKIGGAVDRNRAKRRLRALVRSVLARKGRAGHDYVLIARAATLTRPFAALTGDLEAALARLERGSARAPRRPQPEARP